MYAIFKIVKTELFFSLFCSYSIQPVLFRSCTVRSDLLSYIVLGRLGLLMWFRNTIIYIKTIVN